MREDSAIAVFWTLGMALGIIFTFLSPGFAPDLSAYLFGNILTITFGDIALLGGLAALLILFFSFFLHPIIYGHSTANSPVRKEYPYRPLSMY